MGTFLSWSYLMFVALSNLLLRCGIITVEFHFLISLSSCRFAAVTDVKLMAKPRRIDICSISKLLHYDLDMQRYILVCSISWYPSGVRFMWMYSCFQPAFNALSMLRPRQCGRNFGHFHMIFREWKCTDFDKKKIIEIVGNIQHISFISQMQVQSRT